MKLASEISVMTKAIWTTSFAWLFDSLKLKFQIFLIKRMVAFQKRNKKFHYLNEEIFSAFLSKVNKCSHGLILEEQSQWLEQNNGGVSNMPNITLMERDDNSRGSMSNTNRDP